MKILNTLKKKACFGDRKVREKLWDYSLLFNGKEANVFSDTGSPAPGPLGGHVWQGYPLRVKWAQIIFTRDRVLSFHHDDFNY